MRRIFYSYHGLGDNIILTPVLRKYKELNPDDYVGVTYLKRLPVPDLMKKCKYVDEWIPIKDVWNDFENFEIGYKDVLKDITIYAEINNFDEIIPVTMSPSLGITHKIHRAAYELGITVDDYHTEIFPRITKKTKEQADKFLENVEEPYLFVHFKTGNSPKDINRDIAIPFLKGYSPTQVIEYGNRTVPAQYLSIGNIPLEMEILSRCSKVVCADSFIMHAAGVFGIPTRAIFTHTPPQWVIPLHDTPLEIFVKI